MSRKSRNRTGRGDTPDLSEVVPNGTVHRLTGDLKSTFEALVSGLALLARAPDPVNPDLTDAQLDELAAVHDDFGGPDVDGDDEPLDVAAANASLIEFMALSTHALARGLLERTLGRKSNRSLPNAESTHQKTADLTGTEILDQLTRSLDSRQSGDVRLSRAERRDAIDEARLFLRQIGLEEFDVSCDLVEIRDGPFYLEAVPVPPQTAHVALIEFLVDRAEAVATADPLLAIERFASQWEFLRWSAAPTPGGPLVDAGSFTQQVREQEYSLARRPTVALGSSIIGEIAADEVFAELFPRQHRLAEALVASFVGVFECLTLDGNRATFRAVRDGQTFDVHEHMVPAAYKPGYIALGRLIPLDDKHWVRSPGMIFGGPPIEPVASEAVKALDDFSTRLSPELALEAVIASLVFRVHVPREIKPAKSRANAQDLLDGILDVLIDAPEPDSTLDDFMDALAAQAGAGPEIARPPKRGKPKNPKQKSKRRR